MRPSLFLLILVSLIALVAVLIALPFLAIIALWLAIVRLWRRRRPAAAATVVPPASLDAESPLVVAVHGTWAHEAAWAMAGSTLQVALVEALGRATGDAVAWHAFSWSGDNSPAGRRGAVAALTDLVRAATAAHPDRFVLIVGHSHGGNIAATVAQRLSDRSRLHVVTLATPFLTVIQRSDTKQLGRVLTLVPVVTLSLTALVVAQVLQWPWPQTAAVTGIALISTPLGLRFRKRQQPTLDALRESTLDPERLDALRPRTLIVSRINDEADAVLRLTAFAINWVVRTMGQAALAEGAQSLGEQWSRALASGGPGLTPRGVLNIGWSFWRSRSAGLGDLAALLLGLLLLSLLQLVAGTSSTLVSVALNVGSSNTPPGVWQHLQSTWSSTSASLLSHSQIYDDRAVIAAVAVWASRAERGLLPLLPLCECRGAADVQKAGAADAQKSRKGAEQDCTDAENC